MRRNVLAGAVHQYRSDTFHCALAYFGMVQSMQEPQLAATLAAGGPGQSYGGVSPGMTARARVAGSTPVMLPR